MASWHHGIMALWHYGIMASWHYASWHHGIMALWHYSIMAVWHYASWHHGMAARHRHCVPGDGAKDALDEDEEEGPAKSERGDAGREFGAGSRMCGMLVVSWPACSMSHMSQPTTLQRQNYIPWTECQPTTGTQVSLGMCGAGV